MGLSWKKLKHWRGWKAVRGIIKDLVEAALKRTVRGTLDKKGKSIFDLGAGALDRSKNKDKPGLAPYEVNIEEKLDP